MQQPGSTPPSSARLLERRTPHVAIYDRPPPRAAWLTPAVIPALVVLLAASVLIYVFAAR